MSPPTLRRLSPRGWLFLALVVGLALAAAPALVSVLAAARVRSLAAARGFSASWTALRVFPPVRAEFRGLRLIRDADRDTIIRAETLSVALDPLALLVLHPRVAQLVAGGVRFTPRRNATDPDTLAPEPESVSGERPGDPRRAERVRAAARELVRPLAAPARSLPRLSARDLTVTMGADDDEDEAGAPAPGAPAAGLHIAALSLEPARGGITLAAAGTLLAERPVPFTASLVYSRDDRIAGTLRFAIPVGQERRIEPLTVAVDGALRQERRAGRVTIADTTRLSIGSLRFRLGGSLERGGPAARLAIDADSLTAAAIRASLPDAVLGPLTGLAVRGWFGWRARLGLDLSRLDDVELAADVTPHGMQIAGETPPLDLLALEEPFVASIHLPRGRIVERDLSPANPHFRPLERIDTLLVGAVLTNEDGAFYRHRGFNLEAVRSAIADNLRAGAFRRGAGTITMQLVRNLYLGHERTLSRKAQEVVLAWVLEHLTTVSKRRMLEIYLNIIEWGPGVHGADEASWYYLGHDAGHVTLDEALFLATVIPSPSKWRYRFGESGELRPFERAQMNFIGRAMVARGWLAPETLPPAESLHVELGGPARLMFGPAPSDTLTAPGGESPDS